MYLALAQWCISTGVLWRQVLYIHISIPGKGWSFQKCLCDLRAQIRFCLPKSPSLHKETFYSASLSKDLPAWNAGEVPATARVGWGRRNSENQKSDSCWVYFTCASWICCRDCSCPSTRTRAQWAAEEGSETGVVSEGRRVRCGRWREGEWNGGRWPGLVSTRCGQLVNVGRKRAFLWKAFTIPDRHLWL